MSETRLRAASTGIAAQSLSRFCTFILQEAAELNAPRHLGGEQPGCGTGGFR